MSKKLALVSCRSSYIDNERVYPPLGILYLKSAVEKETTTKVDLIDTYNLKDPDQFKKYDIVGVSTMTPQRKESKKILNHLRKYTTAKTIIGGPHALHYGEEVAKEKWDYIVKQDGQRSLINIIKGEAERIQSDHMNKNNWAEQPRPDRSSKKAKKFLNNYSYSLQGKPAGTMLTATGCPMRCTFCEDAQTKVRWSDIDTIKKELDDIVNLGYKGVYLFDDLFAIAMPKVKPIAEELKKRDLVYRCNGQANYFTKWGEDFAKLLADTGCTEIAFGHESGSQKILNNVNKRTTTKQNWDSIRYAKKYGINVKSFIMLGLPGEDWNTLYDTEQFIKHAGMDDFQCAIYYPYKGTAIRDNLDKGLDDLMFEGEGLGAYGQKGGNTESVIRTDKLTSQDLLTFRNYLVQRYTPKSHSKKWEDGFFKKENGK